MRPGASAASLLALGSLAGWLLFGQVTPGPDTAALSRLWQHRNLGKAFYENPTTPKEAVEQFRQALALAPASPRERLNYGLALLRSGETAAAVSELERVEKQDPRLPHPWFNLGVAYKKEGDFDKAQAQFQGMLRLTPSEPVAHYQLGTLLKIKDDTAGAVREFETARDLNPRLAAPHFQLYGLYRQSNRPQDAATELRVFQDLKKQQEGAAVPEDMDWCQYAEIYDPADQPPSQPLAPPVYRDQKLGDGFSGVAALALDGVHAGLVAWGSAGISLYPGGKIKAADSGLDGIRDVVFVAPGDFDNDGLPDLCIVTTRAAMLYRNVNGRFRKQADLAAGSFRQAIWLDFDHDYDEDLILVGDDSRLLRNNGAAGFTNETPRFPFAQGSAVDIARFDADPESTGFDLLVRYRDRPPVLYRDRLGGRYEAGMIGQLPPENAGPVYADFDGTGRSDRARVAADGSLHLDHEVTPQFGNWIEVALAGVKNPKLALNARIEVKAGSSYQRVIYQGLPVVFRLADGTSVDTVRITWPNGLIQNETGRPVNRIAAIKEAQRLSGSCPMIFTWNGARFEFVTDVLGVAPLGASSGDGRYFPVDHDEWVSIPGAMLRPRGGAYEVRVTEELHEVSYLDRIELVALDHPASMAVVTNEKFKSPPFPEFRLFGVEHKFYPVEARDEAGRDVRAALLQRDRVYVDGFPRDHAGVAEKHTLELDFGDAAPGGQAVLVLNGWVDWADGSTFLAEAQAHRDLVFPYLEVQDAAGGWKMAVKDMGIPSGKPKNMAVEFRFLPGSRTLRIVTNLCVYWDEIFLVESGAAPPVRMTTVPLESADLHFRGFSRATIHPQRKQPEMFDYQTVGLTSMWNPTAGRYTRYGAVAELLAGADDHMVVMGSGDEIALRFAGGGLPEPPRGWTRDFLLLVDGWAKDADANTAFSQTVMPLPFHAMRGYGDRFPYEDFVKQYLTRPALRLIRPLEGE